MTAQPIVLVEPFPKWAKIHTDLRSVVYFTEDARRDVIYVGQSANWPKRFGFHGYMSSWWPQVHLIRILPVETDLREAVEEMHIRRLQPRHNIAHTDAMPASIARAGEARRAGIAARKAARAAARAEDLARWTEPVRVPTAAPLLLTLGEVCELLGRDRDQVLSLVDSGRLGASNLGIGRPEVSYRFRLDEIDEALIRAS
jgi:excisionase family DNA binding protein